MLVKPEVINNKWLTVMNSSSSQYWRANYGYLVFGNVDYPGTGWRINAGKWYLSS